MARSEDTLLLYHVSPTGNAASIAAHGLTPHLARGRRKVVWLATAAKVSWAIEHVGRRPGCHPEQLTVYYCWRPYPSPWLRRVRRGVWVAGQVVRPRFAVPVLRWRAKVD